MDELDRKSLKGQDEALAAIRRIETFAGLQVALDQRADATPVEAVLVSGAAAMMRTETVQLRQALEAMRDLVLKGQ